MSNLAVGHSPLHVGRAVQRALGDEVSVVDALQNPLDGQRRVVRDALQSTDERITSDRAT